MKSRRNFVKQSALVTTALLAANPFKSLASWNGSLLGNSGNNHLVLLHTAETSLSEFGTTYNYIKNVRSASKASTLLVHAGQQASDNIQFDVQSQDDISVDDYSIVMKGNIKTGFIRMTEGETNIVAKVNRIAYFLKKEQDCQMVIFLSQLGFRNQLTIDDLKLAAATEHLDMIISGHEENYCKHTMVARNKKKREVIIQSSKGQNNPCGKVEITFNGYGEKTHIHIASKLLQDVAAA